jgi:hypothetical protein
LAIAPADHDENSATDPDETDLSTPTELTRA